MTNWLLGVLALLLVGALIWRERGGRFAFEIKPKFSALDTQSLSPFHAVSIKFFRPKACEAAIKLARKRFLATEAPELPLAGCTSRVCDCTYYHHEDRRKGPRRAKELGVPRQNYEGDERRRFRGRRVTDIPEEELAEEEAVDTSESYYDYLDTQAVRALNNLDEGQ